MLLWCILPERMKFGSISRHPSNSKTYLASSNSGDFLSRTQGSTSVNAYYNKNQGAM